MNGETEARIRMCVCGFPYIGLTRLGGWVRGEYRNIVYRIGRLAASNKGSVTRLLLDRKWSGQKLAFPYIDEEDVPKAKPLTGDEETPIIQLDFARELERAIAQAFDRKTGATTRYSRIFGMMEYDGELDTAFILQVISFPLKRDVTDIMRKMCDWVRLDMDIPCEGDPKAAEAARRAAGRMISRSLGEMGRTLREAMSSLFASFSNTIGTDFHKEWEKDFTDVPKYGNVTYNKVLIKSDNPRKLLKKLFKGDDWEEIKGAPATKPRPKAKARPIRTKRKRARVRNVGDTILRALRAGECTVTELAEIVYGNVDLVSTRKIQRAIARLREDGHGIRENWVDGVTRYLVD